MTLKKEPKKEPMRVLTLKQKPREKPVKVLVYKTGTKNQIESERLLLPRSLTNGWSPIRRMA